MKVTILGSGTSGGVPRAPAFWGSIDPAEPKNRRTRASVMVEQDGFTLVIDTSPDFRQQALREDIGRVDAVLFTHDHADHCHGIDDVRGYVFEQKAAIPAYSDAATMAALQHRFGYIFDGAGDYPALCEAHVIEERPTPIGPFVVTPFAQGHGAGRSLGYRINNFAYSTDVNRLDDAAFGVLAGVDLWVVDALRHDPHPTHAHLALTLSWIERLKPRQAVLTHLAYDMDYQQLLGTLPEGVEPGFDGLSICL